MRRALLAIALLALLAGCTVQLGATTDTGPAPESGNATVTHVVDGDTVEVRFADGREETVRLLGVDTPEFHADVSPGEFGVPDTEAGRACLREWGERAGEFAADRLAGREVRVVVDPAADRRGYYGRLLAYVHVGDTSFNYRLLDRGYARVYESAFARRDSFDAAEATAQSAGRGVWTCRATGGDAARLHPSLPAVTPALSPARA